MTKNIVSYYAFDYFYKTEVLKDAEEMGKRLQALQERMKQQQLLQDEAKTTSGGIHKKYLLF
jgi:sensor histidine kinase YesM